MVAVASAVVIAAVVAWGAVKLGPQLGYVDEPDDPTLKAHTQPAVPLGGVAVFVAVHSALWIGGVGDVRLLAATGIVFALGLVDDRVGLSPVVRLLLTAASGAVLAAGVEGWGARLFVVGLVVVAVNAVNLFDGLDGLAGSAALMAALVTAGLAWVRDTETLGAFVIAGAVMGFLVFNWHPARLFLGDNGAYVVGVFLVWAIVSTGSEPVHLTAGTGVLGVFLVDLGVTVLRRLRAGVPLFAGDRSHLYDRLHAVGRSIPRVAVTSAAAQAVLGLIVVTLAGTLSDSLAAAGTVVLGLVVVAGLTLGPWPGPPAASTEARGR